MANFFGVSGRLSANVESIIDSLSIGAQGNLEGCEPVARIICSAE